MIEHASDALGKQLVIEDFDKPEIRQFFYVWFPLATAIKDDR